MNRPKIIEIISFAIFFFYKQVKGQSSIIRLHNLGYFLCLEMLIAPRIPVKNFV